MMVIKEILNNEILAKQDAIMIRKEINRLTEHWKQNGDTPEQTGEVVELKRKMFKYFSSWFCKRSHESKTGIWETWNEELAKYVKDWEKKNPRILAHLADLENKSLFDTIKPAGSNFDPTPQKPAESYAVIWYKERMDEYNADCERLRIAAGETECRKIIERVGEAKLFDEAQKTYKGGNDWLRHQLSLGSSSIVGKEVLRIWLRETKPYSDEIAKAKAAVISPTFKDWFNTWKDENSIFIKQKEEVA